MPKKTCIVGGEIFEGPGSRCPAHAYKRWANVKESSRISHRSGWDRYVRPKFLREEPTCRSCGAPSRVVDHIVNKSRARELGWTEEMIEDRSNLQGLCSRCHNSKTAAEGHAARRRRRR
jgi:5-methylcytosine-specific restriction endonuclease McrA